MAYDFSAGTNRGIDYTTVYTPTSGPCSLFATIYPTSTAANQYVLNVNDGSGVRAFTLLLLTGTLSPGQFQLQVATTGTFLVVRPSAVVTLNAWNTMGVSWDGSLTLANVALYLNGSALTGDDPSSSNGSGSLVAASGGWRVSGRSSDNTFGINGRIGTVAWWDRQLSADEWAALAKGYDPIHFRRGLRWSPELIRGTQDRITGQAGSLANAPVVIEHPRMFLQDEGRMTVKATVVVPPSGGFTQRVGGGRFTSRLVA